MTHRGERRDVAPKAALALGIAFNELATNAVKYGALSNAAGSILIEWTIEAAPGCKSVTSAATVEKALALINAQVFDVALLDMNLNGNDSHPVAEALSARGVPFVYTTGNTGQSLRDGYSDRPVLKSHSNIQI